MYFNRKYDENFIEHNIIVYVLIKDIELQELQELKNCENWQELKNCENWQELKNRENWELRILSIKIKNEFIKIKLLVI
jgi:hypothetical protein